MPMNDFEISKQRQALIQDFCKRGPKQNFAGIAQLSHVSSEMWATKFGGRGPGPGSPPGSAPVYLTCIGG